MINKESLKDVQNDSNLSKSMKSEYQTARLFIILGAMTVALVLVFKLVQNGPSADQSRNLASPTDLAEVKK
jgi:hypothetical protein